MNFPGSNTIILSTESLLDAVQLGFNAMLAKNDSYVYVTAIEKEYSANGGFRLTFTTDVPKAEVVEIKTEQAA